MPSAVVFAYHNVGVRCIKVLLSHGMDVALVVTHADNPDENIWFDSVAELAALHDIPVITPDDPNAPEIVAQIAAARPDFLFSFYYRHMLKKAVLDIPPRGAYNMHGSLLPKYRGRVPVNWAIIKGEKETGATLHVMNEKPDNGAIVDRQAVPILPDDTALEVFHKVTCAAETALYRCLPGLLAGTAVPTPQDLSQGAYFGGRRAADGRIDWSQSAQDIHNLIRAIAPPYPGAFSTLGGQELKIFRSHIEHTLAPCTEGTAFYCENGRCYARCGDGKVLRVLAFALDGSVRDAANFAAAHEGQVMALGE